MRNVLIVVFAVVAFGVGIYVAVHDRDSVAMRYFKKEPVELYSQKFSVTTNIGVQEKLPQFLKADFVISTFDEDVLEKINAKSVPIQEALVQYVNSASKTKMVDPQKRPFVKKDMAKVLGKSTGLKIDGVYITDLVVQ